MIGACPCGGVTVAVPAKPGYLNSCDCTLCFKLGTLWGYFNPAEVTVEGETRAFTRSDIEVWLQTNFCPTCSAVISWSAVRDLGKPLMGVNMRLFDPDALLGLPIRFPNGRDWGDDTDRLSPRHAEVPFGRDAPF